MMLKKTRLYIISKTIAVTMAEIITMVLKTGC